ncbi:hypothetical protein LUU34_01526000 [Aix galericulata]|nr:hypothetical protein LUU34_01526000 [Aix galericulata]
MAHAGRCLGTATAAWGFPRSCSSPRAAPKRLEKRKMPQRVRFWGIRRGSSRGMREQMEVGEQRGKGSGAVGFPVPSVGFPVPAVGFPMPFVGFLHVSPLQQGRGNGEIPLLLLSGSAP